MTPSTSQPQPEDRLDRWIGFSVAFHALLFAAFAVRAFFGPSTEIPMEHAIRVDLVSLPDKGLSKPAPLEKPPAPEPPKPKPVVEEKPAPPAPVPVQKAETPKVNLNKTKHDEQSALKRIEALAKLQKSSEQSKPSEEPAPDAAPSQPVKGNEISQGSSLKGIAKLENERYSETVQTHVTRHWNLPGFLSNASLSALVRVFIDGQGNLLKKTLVRSSGNPVFDQSAMQAVDSSLPLPRPPSALANLVSVRGIDIDFTPEH